LVSEDKCHDHCCVTVGNTGDSKLSTWEVTVISTSLF
jgi:hypothetical protein